jgi:hypothetical protein
MRTPHILLLKKNVLEVRRELAGIFSKRCALLFDAEVKANVLQLFSLGENHYQFAKSLQTTHWRQVVSRAYYGAYGVSRAVRLAVDGQYSQEAKDHARVGQLPEDFPKKNTYANRLRLLRDDRNLCDYDHTAVETDLGMSSTDALALVREFVQHARSYLRARKYRV